MNTAISTSFDTVHGRIQQSRRCQVEAGFYQLSFQAMNTHCRVNFASSNRALAQGFQDEVLRWVAWFEAQYSRFIPDSLISRINAAAGLHWVEIDPETEALFALCHDMVFFSRGVFDPTSLPLLRLWNWKANPPALPTKSAIAASLELVGWRKVQRRPGAIFLPREGMCLDLGGIGKEYAVDRVIEKGLERGITDLLVDFGQDVRVHGHPPGRPAWHIGLEDPLAPGKCWTGVAVNNHAVATSGDYVRHFMVEGRRYGHIIDIRDGYPVDNGCLSASIIAADCTVAGIISTSAFILGPKEGLDLIKFSPGIEGAIATSTNRLLTRNFSAYATK
jgi:thiamine biosynthesis lipoprotein